MIARIVLVLALVPSLAAAQADPAELEPPDLATDEPGQDDDSIDEGGERVDAQDDLDAGDVYVRTRVEDAYDAPGSVSLLDEEALDRMDYNDPLAQLVRVPGVYVRQEDGFGLRPNIGLRGASAERSRKITLMEDGVLMAPAPYSAPAAYYFPLMARITELEVAMGPSAILHGPNTVGGAIDLRGRAIPARREGRIDLAMGNTWLGRAHLHYGDSNEWGGFLIEALHLRSSGFRHVDGISRDDDTGFHRTDVVARGELHGTIDGSIYHRVELTVGLGLEESNETYLGLTDSDFRADPSRRYAATQLDRMEWWRSRVQLRYQLMLGEELDLTITAYRHDLERTWHRLDRVCGNRVAPELRTTCTAETGLDTIVTTPGGVRDRYLGVLTGAGPTEDRALFPLLMAINHRIFAVQGLQASGNARMRTGDFAHHVQFGARIHFDEITRDHRGDTWTLSDQLQMTRDATPELVGEQNHASSWALAAYLQWAVTWNRLTITPGARAELVWMRFDDRATAETIDTEQYALLPGIGAQYAITDDLAVFAGAHLGFSPVAPGQVAGTLPETAWNYEVGARYGRASDPTHGQVALFASDYDNLTTNCAGASGCGPDAGDVQFNSGQVLVLGIEAQAAHVIAIDETAIPLLASYTWTWSRFATGFESENPQFGSVSPGFQLPYVPEHQLSVQAGLVFRIVELNVASTFVSRMRDQAGSAPIDTVRATDAYFTLDATAKVEVLPGFRLYVRGENLTNAQPLVSYRPWGARTTRPILVQGGIEIDIR